LRRRGLVRQPDAYVLKDGTTLATLADAGAFILAEPEHIQLRAAWQHAIKYLMRAAETGDGIEEATRKVEDALFLTAVRARLPGRKAIALGLDKSGVRALPTRRSNRTRS
jgi:hypothetical protein